MQPVCLSQAITKKMIISDMNFHPDFSSNVHIRIQRRARPIRSLQLSSLYLDQIFISQIIQYYIIQKMRSMDQTTVFFVLTTRYLCKRADCSVPFLGSKDTPAISCRRISIRYTAVYQSLIRMCSVGSLTTTLRILIFQHSCFPFFSSRS